MNIIAICGSPRRGNTEFALRKLLTKAEELGHKTELVLLKDKKIEHCRGCLSCDDTGTCPILDDMNSITERMTANDVIIFGSPNYFNNVSGLMKDFFDRLNPAYKNKSLGGKKLISLCVGASKNGTYPEKMTEVMSSVADLHGIDFVGDLYLNAKNAQGLENDPENIKKIDDFTVSVLS